MLIERTGNIYSFASVEFKVTFPDGRTTIIWSPPWADTTYYDEESKEICVSSRDYDDPKQEQGARRYAKVLWFRTYE